MIDNPRAQEWTYAGILRHKEETGHDNWDSDDDYEKRCRQCDFSVHYDAEKYIDMLEARIEYLEDEILNLLEWKPQDE